MYFVTMLLEIRDSREREETSALFSQNIKGGDPWLGLFAVVDGKF